MISTILKLTRLRRKSLMLSLSMRSDPKVAQSLNQKSQAISLKTPLVSTFVPLVLGACSILFSYNTSAEMLTPAGDCSADGTGGGECLFIGSNESVYTRELTGSGWQGWQDIGSVFNATPNCVSRQIGSNDCFVRGNNNRLYTAFNHGSGWSGWHDLGGNIKSDPECFSREPNHLECVVQGADDALQSLYWTAVSGWSSWQNLGGIINGQPSCVSWNSNHHDCYVRAADNTLQHKWWAPEQGWSGWDSRGGVLDSSPSCVARQEGVIDCFAVGTDKALHKISYANTYGWYSWESLGGNLVSKANCLSRDTDSVECFALDQHYGVQQKYWSASTGWLSWHNLGGRAKSAPNCWTLANNHAECFVLGTDNSIHANYNFDNNWSGWNSFGQPSPLANPKPLDFIADAAKTRVNDIDFAWSSNGPIAEMFCIQINEGAEPAETSWADNYFCSSDYIGMQWYSAGAIAGMNCTQIYEGIDPHTWHDNYLCLPVDSKYSFSWNSAGQHGALFTQWSEDLDPATWNDNYLTISSDSMHFLAQKANSLGSDVVNLFNELNGIIELDINIDHIGLPHESDLLRASGFIYTNNIKGDHLLSQALRQVMQLAASLGMPQPTPYQLSLTRTAAGTLDLALNIKVLDTWQHVNINPTLGAEVKFRSLNLVFHMVGGKGAISYPIDATGEGFVKPTAYDHWTAVQPKVTVVATPQGMKVTLGGKMVGQCSSEPQVYTALQDCNADWNVLSQNLIFGNSVYQGSAGYRVGEVAVTYLNGQVKSVKGGLEQARINIPANPLTFNGQADMGIDNTTRWILSGSTNYGGVSFAGSGFVANNGDFLFSGTRGINVGGAQGTNTLTVGPNHAGARFEGQFCATYSRNVCNTVCPFPFVCNWVCDAVDTLSCTPSFGADVGTDGNVCANVPAVGNVCLDVLQ
ncbi:DUF346 domain-containing protein [Algibacillus agarilyticus]|uniref:DUF346 domain-containing protein n=1 Tax=Algibacillus agarilyticus TaxID=2234133 RepID=UPI000DCF8FC6|nr:DUF346 domain-containing protein [Algibacillus agarilyticus]